MLERRAKRLTADGFEQPSRRVPAIEAHFAVQSLVQIAESPRRYVLSFAVFCLK